MLVRDVMTRPVVVARANATIHEAAARLTAHAVTSLPVVDGDGRLVGLVGEADVLRDALVRTGSHDLLAVPVRDAARATRVGEVMEPEPLSVRPATDLATASRLMLGLGLRSLVVTEAEGGRVVGIVSRADVVAQLARRDERVLAELREVLAREHLAWEVDVIDGVVLVGGPRGGDDVRRARALVAGVRGVVGVRIAGE